jgi:hypothetical protein
MKSFWTFLSKILVVLLILAGVYIYQQEKKHAALESENTTLRTTIQALEESLAMANDKNSELEKKSVEGILRETNKVVVSGWETLLNTVEQELNKARKMIEQKKSQEKEEETTSEPSPTESKPTVIDGERT